MTRLPAAALRPPAGPAAQRSARGPRRPDRPVTVRLPPAADVTPLVAGAGPARADPGGGALGQPGRRAEPPGCAGPAARWRACPRTGPRRGPGAAVVVGARAAAWAPCPGLAAVVVVDGHDEALGQEQAPTWHAVTVAAERARRAGVPCVVISACPTLELLAAGPVRGGGPPARAPGLGRRRGGRPAGRRSPAGLYSERLVAFVRAERRVVCVLNRTGRARLSGVRLVRRAGPLRAVRGGRWPQTRRAPPQLVCPQCGLTCAHRSAPPARPPACAPCGWA